MSSLIFYPLKQGLSYCTLHLAGPESFRDILFSLSGTTLLYPFFHGSRDPTQVVSLTWLALLGHLPSCTFSFEAGSP